MLNNWEKTHQKLSRSSTIFAYKDVNMHEPGEKE